MLETFHRIFFKGSWDMCELEDSSIDLVVTSPPYPMIEMWDSLFTSLDPEIGKALKNNEGRRAHILMNDELNKAWKEVDRVLAPSGIACINIGDATRKIGDGFRLYSNHTIIASYFLEMGYQAMPLIIWKKRSTKPNKFMGSGMLPSNAYATLEHEYILIFRKGDNRKFLPVQRDRRRKSAYFWEERNQWFSDTWELKGEFQKLNGNDLRERSAAFPFELAYRLINMYSIIGDTVLDPFLGTGTTSIAAICAGRNSAGYEVDKRLKDIIDSRVMSSAELCKDHISERLKRHKDFIEKRRSDNISSKYISKAYGFEVVTAQEVDISIPVLKDINRPDDNEYIIKYNGHY